MISKKLFSVHFFTVRGEHGNSEVHGKRLRGRSKFEMVRWASVQKRTSHNREPRTKSSRLGRLCRSFRAARCGSWCLSGDFDAGAYCVPCVTASATAPPDQYCPQSACDVLLAKTLSFPELRRFGFTEFQCERICFINKTRPGRQCFQQKYTVKLSCFI